MNQILQTYKARREALGLTQAAVAAEAGLSPSHINMLESGERNNPTMETFMAWGNALTRLEVLAKAQSKSSKKDAA